MNKKEKWNINKLSLDDLVNKIINKEIILPSFQRNLVWKDKQKEKLFYSIRKDHPIGMLLFFKNNIENSKWYILDGLQRLTTVYDLYRNFFSCIKIEEIKKTCEKFFFHNSDSNVKKFCEIIESQNLKKDWIDWISSFLKKSFFSSPLKESNMEITDINNMKKDILFEKLSHYCCEESKNKVILSKKNKIKYDYDNSFSKYQQQIKWIIRDIFDENGKTIKTNQYYIPCMEYEGDDKEIIEVFTNLNEQGTKLKKIDIYRSVWEENHIEILNDNIQKTSDEFFEDINTKFGIKRENKNVTNSYEIIYYVLKQSLIKTNDRNWIKLIFLKKSDNENFILNHLEILLNIIKTYFSIIPYKSKINWKDDDRNLGQIIHENIKTMEDINKMIKFIKMSFDFSNQIFNELNYLKGNKKNDNINVDLFPSSSHSVAIICNTLFLILTEDISDFDFKKFKNNYYKKYMSRFIYDLISNTFNTSSSKNAFKSVKEKHYINGVDAKELISDLKTYFSREKNKKNVSKNSILIANLIQQDFISTITIAHNDFHYDHLIPKKITKNFKGCNSISNLSLLTEDVNLQKKDYCEPDLISKYDYLFKIEKISKQYEEQKEKLLNAYKIFLEKNNEENFDEYLKIREIMLICIIEKKIS